LGLSLKSLLPVAGAAAGFFFGGPATSAAVNAALGSGIGTLLAGGDVKDAVKNAALAGIAGATLGAAPAQGAGAGAAGSTAGASAATQQALQAEKAVAALDASVGAAPAAATKAASTGIMAGLPKSALAYGALGLLGAAAAEEPEELELTELQKAQLETRETNPYYRGEAIVQPYDYSRETSPSYQDGGLVGAVDQLRNLRQEFNTGIDSVIGGGNGIATNITGIQPHPIGFLGDLQRPQPIADTIRPGLLSSALGEPNFQLLSQTLRAPSRGGPQMLANGGYIQGPGTGRSDSVRSGIYQNGQKVQEARLSDGEFVMTERAVRGLGNGNRAQGAARMYDMMRQYERMA
jgi:hypothetical protein